MKGALNLPTVKREFVCGFNKEGPQLTRKRLWLTAYTNEKPLVAHTRAMNAARRVAIAYDGNFLNTAVSISCVNI